MYVTLKNNSILQRCTRTHRSPRKDAADGSFKLVYLGDGSSVHQLELTWLRDMDRPYDLGDNEIHLAFTVDDMDAALAHHKEMNASVSKMTPWASTSSKTQTATG